MAYRAHKLIPMKTLSTLLVLLFAATAGAQTLYDNCDDVRLHTYGFDIPFSEQQGNGIGGEEWPGWHGTLVQYMPNPGPDDVNDSPSCLEYSRNPSEQWDVVIIETGLFADLGDYVSGAKTMTMDIFSPVPGITIQITLEDFETSTEPYPTGRHSEYTAVTTTGAEWETLEFSLIGTPDETLSDTEIERMVILFNPGNNVAQTFYFDNLMGPELQDPACTEWGEDEDMINDFDCNHNSWNIVYSDGRMSLYPNPAPDDVNDTEKCLEYARNGGAADDVIVGYFGEAIDLSNGAEIRMHTMDTNAPSNFVFSLQDEFGNVIDEQTLSTSESDVWEELIFDFSNAAAAPNITNFVMLYEPGLPVPESIYIDNIEILTEDIPDNVADQGAQSFGIFPNPASAQIRLNGLDAGTHVQIFDAVGMLVKQEMLLSKNAELFVGELAAGYYVVNALKDGVTLTSRLIIE